MGRSKIVKVKKEKYQKKCCVCVEKKERNFDYITEFYEIRKRSQKFDDELLTYYDILEILGLISYEITDAAKAIICKGCKKTVSDFFNFKVMTENLQKEANLPAKTDENYAQMDSIKKYLSSHNYDALKRFIGVNIVEFVEITEQNELKLIPIRRKIKTEAPVDIVSDTCFIDPNQVMIKVEKTEDDIEDSCYGMDDHSEPMEENKSADPNSDNNHDSDEDDGKDAEIFEEDTSHLGIKKTIYNNVQFISRTPESLIGLEERIEKLKDTCKKIPNVKNWHRFVQREAKSKGLSYISQNGNQIRARKVQPPCKADCRLQCAKRISKADRQKNFGNHWSLGDFALQKKFLFERRICEKPRSKHPTRYYLDTFNKDGSLKSKEEVCELMFVRTFDVSKNSLRYLHKKVLTGKVDDLRGTNKRKPTPGHELAAEHAQKYRHFYIDQQMTVRQIFNEYNKICEEKDVKPVLEGVFRNIFSSYNETDFLREEKKKERCKFCYQYYNANDDGKTVLQQEFDHHISLNKDCKNRLRWKRNRLRRTERERLKRELNNLKKNKSNQQQNEQKETTPTENNQPESGSCEAETNLL